MDPGEVKIHIHKHPMTLVKSGRTGYCCGIKFGAISDGYNCGDCDLFFHKICSNAPREINYFSHKCNNTLSLSALLLVKRRCDLCGGKFKLNTMNYGCRKCYTAVHLYCTKHPPAEVVEVPQNHDHKLKLEKVKRCFICATCGKDGDGYPYKCHECRLTFHVNCEKYAAEVNHPSHPLHPLKFFKGEPPAYSDGKCRLCGEKVADYEVYYHCSTCNFTLDMHCVLNPPPLYLHDLNTHDHKLTLMPKSISFTCTTCGLNGDRSPYVCLPCDFTAHNDCSKFPWVININRHNCRVSRTSLVGVVDAKCGVCQKKMDWSCGGYYCKRCPDYVFHTKCATRKDVSDGIEMKDEPEEAEAIRPFKVIDEKTIQHFSHEKHNLRLQKPGILLEEKSCDGCSYPIYHHSFYSCMSCSFILHESCANLPMQKRHMVSNKLYTLKDVDSTCECTACGVYHNKFSYCAHESQLDMRCASVTEPFVHKSHCHPLFYTSPQGVCSACKKEAHHVLRCVEDNCGYVLDFKCALLPYEVKHRVDAHFLSLCYGEDGGKSSGTYWCDICEKETDAKSWFYTSTDFELTLHTNCVLGEIRGFRLGSEVWTNFNNKECEVIRNNSMSRPFCIKCKSRCIFPIILKQSRPRFVHREYYCSTKCFGN